MTNDDADCVVKVRTPHDALQARRHKTHIPMTAEHKAQIIARLQAGEFITDICADDAIPGLAELARQRKADPEFDQAYRDALATCLDVAMADSAAFAQALAQTGDDKAQRIAEIYSNTMARVAEKLSPQTHGPLLKMAGADGGAITVALVQYASKDGASDGVTTD